jgi:LL-diaminopimelate aminotransferase
VVDTLNANGWSLEKPKATIYVWAPVPEKFKGDSGEFCSQLLSQTGVMVTPGRGYGATGEGFFRISLSYPDETLKKALDKIVNL